MDSDKSDEESDITSKHVLEYYKNFSQSKQLPKYFAGTSIAYMPEIASPQEPVEVPQITIDETHTETMIAQPQEHAHTDTNDVTEPKTVSPASSVTSNRKLEWDNGADIGYSNCNTKLHKSFSLPALSSLESNTIKDNPDQQKLSSQIITVISYSSNSDDSNNKMIVSSSSVTNSKKGLSSSSSYDEKAKSRPLSSSSSSFPTAMAYLKSKIGSPGAESTPKSGDTNVVTKRALHRNNVELCITKPIIIECICSKKIGDNKRVQTSPVLQLNSESKQVQTSLDLLLLSETPRRRISRENQSVIVINNSESTNSDAIASRCDSFEYYADNCDVGGGGDNIKQSSTESSKEIPILSQLIAKQHSKNLKTDVDKSIEILQKLLKSKKYDSVTKKRYIKKIVQKIVDSKYSDDSNSNTTTSSSELFMPKKQDNEHIQQRLQENVPWFPAQMSKFTIKTFSNEFLPETNKKSIFTINTPSSSYSHTSLDKQRNSSDNSYDSWKEAKTLSEKKFEEKHKGSGDHLVKYAKSERANQLIWINNEISHLTKLKGLLEKRPMSGVQKTTTVYMLSERSSNCCSSSATSRASSRNYVIQTEIPQSDSSDRCDLKFKGHHERKIVGDIEVVEDDKTTNIKVKTKKVNFGLKPPSLIGEGKYDTFPKSQKEINERCWPCGMAKLGASNQDLVCTNRFTFEVPLECKKSHLSEKVDEVLAKYSKLKESKPQTSESEVQCNAPCKYANKKVCSEDFLCILNCKCKDKKVREGEKMCLKCKQCKPYCSCKKRKREACPDCYECVRNCKCKDELEKKSKVLVCNEAIQCRVNCRCNDKRTQKNILGKTRQTETDPIKFDNKHSQIELPQYKSTESQIKENKQYKDAKIQNKIPRKDANIQNEVKSKDVRSQSSQLKCCHSNFIHNTTQVDLFINKCTQSLDPERRNFKDVPIQSSDHKASQDNASAQVDLSKNEFIQCECDNHKSQGIVAVNIGDPKCWCCRDNFTQITGYPTDKIIQCEVFDTKDLAIDCYCSDETSSEDDYESCDNYLDQAASKNVRKSQRSKSKESSNSKDLPSYKGSLPSKPTKDSIDQSRRGVESPKGSLRQRLTKDNSFDRESTHSKKRRESLDRYRDGMVSPSRVSKRSGFSGDSDSARRISKDRYNKDYHDETVTSHNDDISLKGKSDQRTRSRDKELRNIQSKSSKRDRYRDAQDEEFMQETRSFDKPSVIDDQRKFVDDGSSKKKTIDDLPSKRWERRSSATSNSEYVSVKIKSDKRTGLRDEEFQHVQSMASRRDSYNEETRSFDKSPIRDEGKKRETRDDLPSRKRGDKSSVTSNIEDVSVRSKSDKRIRSRDEELGNKQSNISRGNSYKDEQDEEFMRETRSFDKPSIRDPERKFADDSSKKDDLPSGRYEGKSAGQGIYDEYSKSKTSPNSPLSIDMQSRLKDEDHQSIHSRRSRRGSYMDEEFIGETKSFDKPSVRDSEGKFIDDSSRYGLPSKIDDSHTFFPAGSKLPSKASSGGRDAGLSYQSEKRSIDNGYDRLIQNPEATVDERFDLPGKRNDHLIRERDERYDDKIHKYSKDKVDFPDSKSLGSRHDSRDSRQRFLESRGDSEAYKKSTDDFDTKGSSRRLVDDDRRRGINDDPGVIAGPSRNVPWRYDDEGHKISVDEPIGSQEYDISRKGFVRKTGDDDGIRRNDDRVTYVKPKNLNGGDRLSIPSEDKEGDRNYHLNESEKERYGEERLSTYSKEGGYHPSKVSSRSSRDEGYLYKDPHRPSFDDGKDSKISSRGSRNDRYLDGKRHGSKITSRSSQQTFGEGALSRFEDEDSKKTKGEHYKYEDRPTEVLRSSSSSSKNKASESAPSSGRSPTDAAYFDSVESRLKDLARKISECRCKLHIHPTNEQLQAIQEKVLADIRNHKRNREELVTLFKDIKDKYSTDDIPLKLSHDSEDDSHSSKSKSTDKTSGKKSTQSSSSTKDGKKLVISDNVESDMTQRRPKNRYRSDPMPTIQSSGEFDDYSSSSESKRCKCYSATTQTRCICKSDKIQTDLKTTNEGIQCRCECCHERTQVSKEDLNWRLKNTKAQTNTNEMRAKQMQTKEKDVRDDNLQTECVCNEDDVAQTDENCVCHKLIQTFIEDLEELDEEEEEEDESEYSSSSVSDSYEMDSTETSITYTSDTLQSCLCCKRKNVRHRNFEALRKELSEQAYPLCRPCYRQNQKYQVPVNYHQPSHVCQCYSVVKTKTLNEIKKTIDDINEMDRVCTCVDVRNPKSSGYCRHCKCKLKKTSKSKSGIAYLLTFEDDSIRSEKTRKKKKLEEIRIKVPVVHKKKRKNKENTLKKKKYEDETLSRKRRERLGSPEGAESKSSEDKAKSLQDYLKTNRPDFVQVAESRRKTVNNAKSTREKVAEDNKLEFLKNYCKNDECEKNPRRLFTSKEMKQITKRNYQKLPEVQRKLVENREKNIRQANRLMADTFNRKLRENVLKGKRSLSTDVNVLNL